MASGTNPRMCTRRPSIPRRYECKIPRSGWWKPISGRIPCHRGRPPATRFAYYSERDKTSRLVVRRPDGKETVVAEQVRMDHFRPIGVATVTAFVMGYAASLETRIFDARTGEPSPPDIRVRVPGRLPVGVFTGLPIGLCFHLFVRDQTAANLPLRCFDGK